MIHTTTVIYAQCPQCRERVRVTLGDAVSQQAADLARYREFVAAFDAWRDADEFSNREGRAFRIMLAKWEGLP